MPVRWLSPHPHGRNFFLCGISAIQKDQSFILRVRKYELRVAEPFILCRTLVPIMTAAYYFTLPFTCNNVQSPYIRFLGHSSQHKERIGSSTCPLAVTPPSWSRFLPVRHFCRSERSFVHSHMDDIILIQVQLKIR